ncbi:MAG: hypothetical protein AAFY38_13935 [Pseudomonadota bacterium]
MTRFALILAAAATFGTAAAAGQSDRYTDLRLDTAIGHIDFTEDRVGTVQTRSFAATTATRSQERMGPYAYTNPYGVGPNNDSR